MTGFIEAQAFDIGPGQRLEQAALTGHFLRADDRLEGHVFRAAKRLHLVEQGRQRKTDPGMTIDQPSTQRMR